VSITPAPAPPTQTATSNASPTTIVITSTLSPQAHRAPTCPALSEQRKAVGGAEVAAIVFGLLTLGLLVGMCFFARRCYGMRRVGGKGGRDGDVGVSGGGGEGVGVGVDNVAGHPVKEKLGRRIMDRVVKSCKRKEAWER